MPKEAKPKPGRPTKLSEKTVSLLESHLQFGHSIAESCYAAKISRESFHKWFRESPQFADRMRQARSQIIQLAKQTVYGAIANGDTKAAVWIIEKFAPESFTAPLDDEIPTQGLNEAETREELNGLRKIFFYEWEREFMAAKYLRLSSYRPPEDATSEVKGRYYAEKAKDQEILKAIKKSTENMLEPEPSEV